MSLFATLTLSAVLQQDASFDSYRAHIEAANAALASGDIRRVQAWLDSAPAQHRGWEWSYLSHQVDRSIATFQASNEGITKLAMSPNGELIASTGNDGVIRLWDTQNHQKVAELKGHTAAVFGLQFSPDGSMIVSTCRDNSIRIWDVADKKEIGVLGEHPVSPYNAAFTPDGKRVVSVGWRMHPEKKHPVGLIRVWDVETKKMLSDQDYTTHPLSCLKFSADGSTCFIGTWEFQVAVMNMDTYQIDREIKPPEGIAYSAVDWVDLDSTGKLLMTATKDKEAKIFESETGKYVRSLHHNGHVTSAQFNGKYAVTSSQDNSLRVFDVETGELVVRLLGQGRVVTCLAITPDGSKLFSSDGAGNIKVWDLRDPGSYQPQVSLGGSWSCVFSPDSKRIAVGTNENDIVILDAGTRQVLKRVGKFNNLVVDVAWSANGNSVAGGSNDGTFRAYDVATDQELWKFSGKGQMRSAAWSRDGKYVASGDGGTGIAYVWDAKTGKVVAQHQMEALTLNAAFSPDSKTAYFGSGKKLVAVNIASGKVSQQFADASADIVDVAVSPNGKQVTVGTSGGRIHNFDTANGKMLWTAVTDGTQWGVDWSPDGTRIASTGYDFAMHLWHPQTGKEVFAIRELPIQGFDVRFSPDGEQLAYMGGSGLVWWINKGK
ncbi:MAG: PQQ-binding-like beta-propeller repeat protein [Fimbriimonadaceae bacterium]|nr:PQQ-binding-like beta-propeller repeat protein [Fimbriimonadaceae bacterium]